MNKINLSKLAVFLVALATSNCSDQAKRATDLSTNHVSTDIRHSNQVPTDYKLVWNDEFEDNELNQDWTYEVKKPGWVNNELQEYVASKINGQKVLELKDGVLQIILRKIENKIYSSRIYANVDSGWQYGYFEARIKLPKGKGTWPAFWMMPVHGKTWPGDGEIDIMEEVGFDPNNIVTTVHCNAYNDTGSPIESYKEIVPTAQSEFHIYGLEWTSDYLRWIVDGKTFLQYNNEKKGKDQWPFDAPFYIILNLAWGGDWGGQKGVDESALPASMLVDYVRVYQK